MSSEGPPRRQERQPRTYQKPRRRLSKFVVTWTTGLTLLGGYILAENQYESYRGPFDISSVQVGTGCQVDINYAIDPWVALFGSITRNPQVAEAVIASDRVAGNLRVIEVESGRVVLTPANTTLHSSARLEGQGIALLGGDGFAVLTTGPLSSFEKGLPQTRGFIINEVCQPTELSPAEIAQLGLTSN